LHIYVHDIHCYNKTTNNNLLQGKKRSLTRGPWWFWVAHLRPLDLVIHPYITILTILINGYRIIFPVKFHQIGPSHLGEEVIEYFHNLNNFGGESLDDVTTCIDLWHFKSCLNGYLHNTALMTGLMTSFFPKAASITS